jgi:hypothetical protein
MRAVKCLVDVLMNVIYEFGGQLGTVLRLLNSLQSKSL